MPEIVGSVLPPDVVILRMLAAAALSMVIGWERERSRKPAGLRTHMLVGLGAAAFFLIFVAFATDPLRAGDSIRTDPMRVVEGVIAGIGFLGAGAIIQGRGGVEGLTTGAGVWVAGAIGLACGAGYFVIAGALTALTLVVLAVLGRVEASLFDPELRDD